MVSRYRFFIILSIILACSLAGFWAVHAETTSTGFSVGFTVPSSGGGGGGGGGNQNNPPPPAPPTISSVASSTTFTTASITWNANSQGGISSASFVYGLTNNYGANGTVNGTYKVDLNNLAVGTIYYFKISVFEPGGLSAIFTGTFKTPSNDTAPPVISNIKITPADTTATITWTTNENADSQAQYGLTNQYGSNVADAAKALNHSIQLKNLLPNTTYHYRVLSTDPAGNTAATQNATFLTLKDNVAPPDVSNLTLTIGADFIKVSWSNPSIQVVPDFNGVTVARTVNKQAQSKNDGTIVYVGSGETITDKNVLVNIKYFYTVFSADTSGNISPGTFDSATIASPPGKEVCNNGIDDNNNSKIDCADSDCANDDVCKAPPKEVCNNGIDDDKNGKIDCADGACINDKVCKVTPAEVCNNKIDDDKDGDTDCNDSDCAGSPFCPSQNEICNNGIDDDKNGKTDCADQTCFGFQACQENKKDLPNDEEKYQPPPPTVSGLARLTPEMMVLFAANNKIILTPQKGVVAVVAGAPIMVEIAKGSLPFTPENIILKVDGGDQHSLAYNKAADVYYAIFSAPAGGAHQLALEVTYQNKQFDAVTIGLVSQTFGVVNGGFGPLSGASLLLYKEDGTIWPASDFGQSNPFVTNANGTFYWMAPNGRYTLKITSPGYYDRTVPGIVVINNILTGSFTIITKPPALTDGLDPDASLVKNAKILVGNTVKTGVATARRAAQFASDKADDPAVEKASAQVVAPTSVSIAAVGTLPLISFSDIVPLLRFLFLQPLMLLGIKKRSKWGQVYNTLTKLPVDLATVRLINIATGRLVQSKVTDAKGRYAFVIDPGQYKVEAIKNNMVFPSLLLKNFQVDGSKANIYHGEPINVNEEEAVITANIPLDPVGSGELPKRFYIKLAMRHVQNVVSWAGLAITAISLYISPQWYVWVLLGVHSALLFLFWRLARPPKVKSWGIMYDKDTNQPVGQAVARLFSSQFNKLVGTQMTDRKGRYYFLAGESQYFVTGEHRAYQTVKSDLININKQEGDTIAVNLALPKGVAPEALSSATPISDPQPSLISPIATPLSGLPLPPNETKAG